MFDIIFSPPAQKADGQPVFLKTKTDVRLYRYSVFLFIMYSLFVVFRRGVMSFSVLGIGIALFSIYRMATGQIKKKE